MKLRTPDLSVMIHSNLEKQSSNVLLKVFEINVTQYKFTSLKVKPTSEIYFVVYHRNTICMNACWHSGHNVLSARMVTTVYTKATMTAVFLVNNSSVNLSSRKNTFGNGMAEIICSEYTRGLSSTSIILFLCIRRISRLLWNLKNLY